MSITALQPAAPRTSAAAERQPSLDAPVGRLRACQMRSGTSQIEKFETRRAHRKDADDIAVAHRDSIRSIGPKFYPPHVVDDWAEGITGDVYLKAMEGGEVFFIATGEIGGNVVV